MNSQNQFYSILRKKFFEAIIFKIVERQGNYEKTI